MSPVRLRLPPPVSTWRPGGLRLLPLTDRGPIREPPAPFGVTPTGGRARFESGARRLPPVVGDRWLLGSEGWVTETDGPSDATPVSRPDERGTAGQWGMAPPPDRSEKISSATRTPSNRAS